MTTIETPEESSLTVGQYLATQLARRGADILFGLPGDFNLSLLDHMLTVDGVRWVGSSNELNASYSADAYARVSRGLGAVVTTFGVGELSAVNGMAGSYAEDVPVVHIVGMPSRAAIKQQQPLHHTLLDGDFEHGVRVAKEFSVAQEVLRPEDAAEQIDRVLTQVLTASKPGYIGVPLDVATMPIQHVTGERSLTTVSSPANAVAAFEQALGAHLRDHGCATILAGPRIHRRGLESAVRDIAQLPGVQVASQSASKAILDEDHPASLGTYLGKASFDPVARDKVDEAELLIMAGTITSDFTTGFFSNKYDPTLAVELALDHARIGHAVYPGVLLQDSLAVLHRVIEHAHFEPLPPHESEVYTAVSDDAPAGDRPLDQETLWSEVQQWIQPRTTVLAEAGTAFYGALDLRLPADSDVLGQPVWSSIGYTLPAVLGAGLARPDRRPVLFIGDGSAQLTVQELGNIFRHVANPVIFLLDNKGYTVERCIQSPEAVYQDVVSWDWAKIPQVLGADEVRSLRVTTGAELRDALNRTLAEPESPFFITVELPVMDAPRLLKILTEGISATNSER